MLLDFRIHNIIPYLLENVMNKLYLLRMYAK